MRLLTAVEAEVVEAAGAGALAGAAVVAWAAAVTAVAADRGVAVMPVALAEAD
jgi:hypothetical protein